MQTETPRSSPALVETSAKTEFKRDNRKEEKTVKRRQPFSPRAEFNSPSRAALPRTSTNRAVFYVFGSESTGSCLLPSCLLGVGGRCLLLGCAVDRARARRSKRDSGKSPHQRTSDFLPRHCTKSETDGNVSKFE